MDNIEKKLKDYILSNYKSIREFCNKFNFPYSTVDNIFKRGIMGSSVSLIVKICDCLNIVTDDLINGHIREKQNFNFTDKDYKIISFYRSKPEMQPAVDKLLGITDDNKNEKLTLMTESEPKKITNRGRAVAFGGKSKNIELTEEQEKAVAEALSRLSKKTE
jgi:DNA-binding helix-turn-helix protein|nr:MAG TPA: Regulatory protein [Caudoviricetes sp.]